MATDPQIVPLDIILDSKNLGKDRDNPTFQLTNLENIVGMSVLWANIPFSFYVIDGSCNKFLIRFPHQGLAVDWVVDLQFGTYTPLGLQQEIRRAVTIAGFAISPNDAAAFTVIITSFDSRMLLYHPTLAFQMKVISTELADILGYEYDTWVASQTAQLWKDGILVNDGDLVNYVKGIESVKLLGTPRLNLHSNLSANMVGMVREENESSDVIFSFPITNNFGTYLYGAGSMAIIPIARQNIYKINLYWTQGSRTSYVNFRDNSVSNFLPLNGDGFQVCIRFFQDNGVVKIG